MEFQKLIDSYAEASCVLSVERIPAEDRVEIKIVAANKAYIKSIEHPGEGPAMLDNTFVKGSSYKRYLPQDLNFENYCLRCVEQNQTLHAYVYPEYFKYWFHEFYIPISYHRKGRSYLIFTWRCKKEPEPVEMGNLRQDIMSDVLTTCIKLRSTVDFQKTMDEVVADIRRLCGATFCCILLVDEEMDTCSLLTGSMAEDSKLPVGVNWLDDRFYDTIASTWPAMLDGSTSLIIQDQEQMRVIHQKNHIWYRSLMKSGVESLVMIPLKFREELLGYIWATNFDVRNTVKIKETLELTAYFLSSEIANEQLISRLRLLGSMDALTGLLNRNKMHERLDDLLDERKPFSQVGILCADVNGLKRINDACGHQAGDKLLQAGADILLQVFGQKDVYRAGGDEFVVMKKGADAASMEEAIRHIREYEKNSDNVRFALGYSIAKRRKSLRTAMREADEAMYRDKREFYRKKQG